MQKFNYDKCPFCGCVVTQENISPVAQRIIMKVLKHVLGAPDCPAVCKGCANDAIAGKISLHQHAQHVTTS